jgi:hypothetical protein
MTTLNLSKRFFYLFLFLYFVLGIYLSLNVGITHDESHSYWVWELNKHKLLNVFLDGNFDVTSLDTYHGYYGVGFYFFSTIFELPINIILENFEVLDSSKKLLSKHPSVFIFFFISGLYFNKIIYLITRNKQYSYLSTIFYFSYPYLLGHSFFNVKDMPFMSIWLICTYYLIDILKNYLNKKKIKETKIILLSFLTAYLFSIRISGILIFIEYFIFLFIFLSTFKVDLKIFIKFFYKKIILFLLFFLLLLYLFHPSYWNNPLKFFYAMEFMSKHIQSVCTTTLGECMRAQNLPSSYIPIWLFFKLPVLIIFGLFLFPIYEKKIFSYKNNLFLIGSLLSSVLAIIFFLILFNVNLYDELRQILFIIPLILIISLSTIYFYSKKASYMLLIFFSLYFSFQNIKIFPYNYIWLNNFTYFTKINGVFELDYWGVSTKKISNFLNKENLERKNCIISNRNEGIKAFTIDKHRCFKSFKDLHKNNERPFYVALLERSLNKGVPNRCENIHNEKIAINFSKEELILAKIYVCN